MIIEWKYDDWYRRFPQPPYVPPVVIPFVPAPLPTPAEIDEFRRLLDRAREYDRKNNEPDCETAEKRKKLKDLADALGVEISFV